MALRESNGSVGERSTLPSLEPGITDELADCEEIIERSLGDAWHALKRIHDNKLFTVAKCKTFEEYAEKRWGYSKTHAYRLIDHAKIIDQLKAEGVEVLPSGEGLTRPLQKLDRISKSPEEFQQRVSEAWRMAVDTAPKVLDVPQVTVQHVESTMQHFGLYRNTKRQNTAQAAIDLRDLLTKIGQSDAMKMSPDAFAKRFELKGLPSNAPRIIDWLIKYAEIAGVRD